MTNLYSAHNQWKSRPVDERFQTIAELKTAVESRRNIAAEGLFQLKEINVQDRDDNVVVNVLNKDFAPTHWAFNQLCELAKAPPSYLRTLSAKIIADNLNYGLQGKEAFTKTLLTASNDAKTIRAFTSPNYGRIWDLDLVLAVEKLQASNPAWKNPPAYKITKQGTDRCEMENAGLYASDRDIFMFLVDEEHQIELNTHSGKRIFSRGFFSWNSEVKAKSYGCTTFLYDYVCGNHIVWDAEQVSTFRKIHSQHALKIAMTEMIPVLTAYTQSSMHVDLTPLKRAVEYKIADDKDKVTKFLIDKEFTPVECVKAFEYAEKDGNDGKYLWDVVQNMTSAAREKVYVDDRLNLEKRAGRLLDLVK